MKNIFTTSLVAVLKKTSFILWLLILFGINYLPAQEGKNTPGSLSYEKQKKSAEQDLLQIQKSIKELEEQQRKIAGEEVKVNSELTEVKRRLDLLSDELRLLRLRERKAKERVVDLIKLESGYAAQSLFCRNLLTRELRFFYKWWSVEEFLPSDTMYYFFYMLDQKRNLYCQTENIRTLTGQKRMQWELKQKQIGEIRRTTNVEFIQTRTIKTEKEQTLALTREKKKVTTSEIERLRQTARALQELISKLERKRKEEAQQKKSTKYYELKAKKGNFSWPVEGKLVQPFGKQKHPELNTFIVNNGIKIETSSNKPVKTINDGEVVYAKEFLSYGTTVIIDHGDGFYTVYGSLGKLMVKENMRIETGRIIGETGADPMYFEFRVDGQPDDPMLWLK